MIGQDLTLDDSHTGPLAGGQDGHPPFIGGARIDARDAIPRVQGDVREHVERSMCRGFLTRGASPGKRKAGMSTSAQPKEHTEVQKPAKRSEEHTSELQSHSFISY